MITWLASMALVLRKGSQYLGASLANRSRGTSGPCRHSGKGRPVFQEYFAHNEDWEGLEAKEEFMDMLVVPTDSPFISTAHTRPFSAR